MSQLARDLDRRRLLGGLSIALGGTALAACGSRAGAQIAQACVATPTEIRGPFPADGTNGRPRPINALAMDGLIRRDIRSGFAGMGGSADGVALELELTLVGGSGCTPLSGPALYLWQNDAAGEYSLYTLPETNYLRGLQTAANGRLQFTTIVPGCYGGRAPHCHFEVFASREAALGGAAPLLVSQLAFPEAECRPIYRDDPRYGGSLANLDRWPASRDFMFAGDDAAARARQTIAMTGDAAAGYRGTATVALSAA
ncbi:MAG: hypothetical protein B7Z08_12145 [Sphingomonadales bacterium 32-68-7]|nr:MAG: hypothetical protein B7Z33_11015 [Sphingomonadales bacterium 12-68-11]OYX07551.1 MAG: hypothetical protein B7Z08_12145 [Sphingomonadales bacterium 32-68-7]